MAVSVLYKASNLVDGTGNKPIENAGMLVEDGIIKKVGELKTIQTNENTKIVDLTGKTIIPGMINCHVHVVFEPIGNPVSLLLKETQVKTAFRGQVNLKKHLKSGITYLRDLGGLNYIDIELKRYVSEGLIEGPGMLVSGKVLAMTGGQSWQIARECDGKDECRKAAREQVKAGADIIKIMATGGVMTDGVEPGSLQLMEEEMEAAISEAHKSGKKTAAHATGSPGVKMALLAGIDSIEHGVFLDNETIELMLEKKVYLVPTLSAPYFITEYGVDGGVPKYAVEKTKRIIDTHYNSFIKAKKAGVKIAMGTDSGTPFNMHDKSTFELKLMVQAGISPMEAILATTKTASELLGISDKYGTLQKDKMADFVVLKGNPLDNIDLILDVEKVFKAGRIVL